MKSEILETLQVCNNKKVFIVIFGVNFYMM